MSSDSADPETTINKILSNLQERAYTAGGAEGVNSPELRAEAMQTIQHLIAQAANKAVVAELRACQQRWEHANTLLDRRPLSKYLIDRIESLTAEKASPSVDRIEVIDDTGRAYVKGSIYGSPVSVQLDYQDGGKTLKVLVTADKEQNDK